MNLTEKPLSQVRPEDIIGLLGQRETASLEFKSQPWGTGDGDKVEMLRDIASMANAGGGHIIIGAREVDGACAGFLNVPDPELVVQQIRQCCLDGILERPTLECRPVTLPSNCTVIVLRVEPVQRPHLVTRDGRNEFWRRYDAEKRKMSLDEVRQAVLQSFTQAYAALMRSEIKDAVHEALSEVRPRSFPEDETVEGPQALSEIRQWRSLLDQAERLARAEIGNERFFRLAAVPDAPHPGFVPLDTEELVRLLRHPPGQRQNGWNMESILEVERRSWGIRRGRPDFRRLSVYSNGLVEFRTAIDHSFCWRQSEEAFARRPEIYPYPVVEYPVTFLRMVKAIYELAGYAGDAHWQMQYLNIRGVTLRPYAPSQVGYDFADHVRPFEEAHFSRTSDLPAGFDPDSHALSVILDFYRDFGYSREQVPFFDSDDRFTLA
jgi:hypothetical protein